MRKVIPITHVDKTYKNVILNEVIKKMANSLNLLNEDTDEYFVIRQNFINRKGVENWNSGKLKHRPIEGNRNLLEFVANNSDNNLTTLEMKSKPSKSNAIILHKEHGINISPIRTKSYLKVTLKFSSISRTKIEDVINSLTYMKSVSSVYMVSAVGTFNIPDYISEFVGEVNGILNNKRETKLSNGQYLNSISSDQVKVVTNLSGKTDSLIVEERLNRISVNIHSEALLELEEDVESNIYSTMMELSIDMSLPSHFLLTSDNAISGTPLPPPFNMKDMVKEHYENYIYYVEWITSEVISGGIDGKVIDWTAIDGIVQQGPFKGMGLENEYTGNIGGVFVNGVIYGGEADGSKLRQQYKGNMDWNCLDGLVLDGPFKDTVLDTSFTGLIQGVFVDGTVYGGVMNSYTLNGSFTVEIIEGVIQTGLFKDETLPFPEDTFTGTLIYEIIDGTVRGGILDGREISKLSYTNFTWQIDDNFVTDGLFDGMDVLDYGVGSEVKGTRRDYTVVSGPLTGLTLNGEFDDEVVDGVVVSGIFKDTTLTQNATFSGRLTGHFEDGKVTGGMLDGVDLGRNKYEMINVPVVDNIITGHPFKDKRTDIEFTGDLIGVYVDRTFFGELMNGKTLYPILGGIIIDNIIVGGVMDGKYYGEDITDFTYITSRYKDRLIYDGLMDGRETQPLEDILNEQLDVVDDYYRAGDLEYRLDVPFRLINVPHFDVNTGYEIKGHTPLMSVLISVDPDDAKNVFSLGNLGIYTLDETFLELLKTGDPDNIFVRNRFPLLIEVFKDGNLMSPGSFTFDPITGTITSVEDMCSTCTYRAFLHVLLDFDYLRYVEDYDYEEAVVLLDGLINRTNLLRFGGNDGTLLKDTRIKTTKRNGPVSWLFSVTVVFMKHWNLLTK